MRVLMLGSSGSGKTTVGRALAEQLGVPFVELDALNHQPGWTKPSDDQFRRHVAERVAADGWVVDGNYPVVRQLVLERATTVVWFDYPRWLVMSRVIRRSIRRAITRKELWNGNRERARTWVQSDHPIRWTWSKHRPRRHEYAELFERPEYQHLTVVRISDKKQIRRWLMTIGSDAR
jgi:adenylate kinase family enzyme